MMAFADEDIMFGKKMKERTKQPLSDFALEICQTIKTKKDADAKEQEELALKFIEELELKIRKAASEGETSMEVEPQNHQPLPRKTIIHFEDLGFIIEDNSYPMMFGNFERTYRYAVKWSHLYEQFTKESEA